MTIVDQRELLGWLKPEIPSDYEINCSERIDDVDYAVYKQKLNLILSEAMDMFVRCGISDLAMAGDVGVALFTPEGDLVACNVGSYLHVVSSVFPIKYIMRKLRHSQGMTVRGGDFYFCNDPLYGAVHNADQIVMMPIFHNGTLVAWTGATAHTGETGATEPGGMPVTARSRFDEGMKMAPFRIGERYQLRPDLLQMMENYVSRSPRTFMIELRARVSACDRVRIRIQELVQAKGAVFLTGLFRKILVEAETSARARIRGWNDGIYRAVTFTDSIGLEEGLQRVSLTLTKFEDSLVFDFNGTSPEHEGSYHAFPHATAAHAAIYLFGWPFYDLPRSSGTLASCEFKFAPGTALSPSSEATTSNSVMIGSAVMSLLPNCFSKMMFDSPQRELVSAAMGNTGSGYVISGLSQWNVPFSDMLAYPLNTEGGGGKADSDGVDAMGFPWCPSGRASNVEDEEHDYPIICITQKLARDSCGFGRYRGRSGTQMAVTPHHVEHLAQMSISKNSRLHTTQGLFGGYPPRVIPGIVIRNTDLFARWQKGDQEILHDIHDLIMNRSLSGEYMLTTHYRPVQLLKRGDIFVEFSSGGPGYGDVLEREAHSVLADIKQGIISEWVADQVYLVSYDPLTFELDDERTTERRKEARAYRCQKGLPYRRFMRDWEKLRPSEELLRYYGNWPDASPNRDVIRM
ncbi:hydantoinase B/oxoprolinase family protein [Paenibacillus naphthalenovorans]|uniref:hydantoinase B/oxoprolinase family protein n=1 Tax=Paenibacillus naphthalenovorans TaxID=162209 RepID=UPI0008891E34|nr:hydantoinase B/oxoprolinase family protein [Paenibacillus naphthalenovorans]SDJ73695.1 acetophenone carboxylase [Paenibacillus naphthalenovorans]